ncbi:hypothetical protein M9434_002166 [Picochlorum sp. BPE23]|nr:hypothetical protein M9434_002166 [Picochlorum sp. BPE23]
MEGRGGDLSQERLVGKVEEDTVGEPLERGEEGVVRPQEEESVSDPPRDGIDEEEGEDLEVKRVTFASRLAAAAGGFGGAVYRTAAAAGTMLSDRALRQKGAEVISSNAAKGMKGIQQGLSTGAYGIQRGFETLFEGPRQIQNTLARLSKQFEEQRMKALLEEEKDAPMDVQIGFAVYEDAPQELRSRLWMALMRDSTLRQEFSEEYSRYSRNQRDVVRHVEARDESAMGVGAPSDVLDGGDAEKKNSQDEEEWEVMGDRGTGKWRQGGALLKAGKSNCVQPWNSTKEDFKQRLMEAMIHVEWPLESDIRDDGRYATLLQISVGQEDIDEVISRDIHRTFPEHPLFGFEQGQKSLFNLLKAYSLHDLEVGYCQGMAFVAGLLLFFVPEEQAFEILCRFMDAPPYGFGLRKLYLPGLMGLKVILEMFDILLEKHMPNLKSHLESNGATPVLYASQWFLSLFSCPFPVPFCARIIDIMLLEGSDAIILRTAIAIMGECEAELMMQENFEELLMYLKVDPLRWDSIRLRRVVNGGINSPITDEELHDAFEQASKYIKSLEEGAVSSDKDGSQTSIPVEESLQDTIEKQDSEMASEYGQIIQDLDTMWNESASSVSSETQENNECHMDEHERKID